MNFIWNAVADRLKEFQAILGPNFKRILIIDCMQPMAQRWWAQHLSRDCDAIDVKNVNDFNQLTDKDLYDLIIWTLPPVHLLQEPIAQAVWTKLRMHTNGFLIFVTPGPMLIPTLNQVLGTDIPNMVLDLHDIGDQLSATGWQRPMLQGQTLSIQYKKRETILDDWLSFGDVASHPLWPVAPMLPPTDQKLTEPLTAPVQYDITVGLVYNGPDRTVQQQFDDGSIAIPVNQIKKKS